MFTGIVTEIGRISAISDGERLRRIRIEAGYDATTIALGASIACSGPCLTVVAAGARNAGCWFEAEAAAETLDRTTVGRWRVGDRINLERPLKIGDELGGHLVGGHIDAVAEIIGREEATGGDAPWGAGTRFVVRAPRALAPFIAEKGSVTLDGTSLTVNEVDGDTFGVMIIPHTLAVTTWGERRPGDAVNLEVDMLARYAARLAEARAAGY